MIIKNFLIKFLKKQGCMNHNDLVTMLFIICIVSYFFFIMCLGLVTIIIVEVYWTKWLLMIPL